MEQIIRCFNCICNYYLIFSLFKTSAVGWNHNPSHLMSSPLCLVYDPDGIHHLLQISVLFVWKLTNTCTLPCTHTHTHIHKEGVAVCTFRITYHNHICLLTFPKYLTNNTTNGPRQNKILSNRCAKCLCRVTKTYLETRNHVVGPTTWPHGSCNICG